MNSNTRTSCISLLLIAASTLLLVPSGGRLHAQPGLVHTGPDGIYVALGTTVLPADVDGVSSTAYLVERREQKGEWLRMAEVNGPASQQELDAALGLQLKRFPELADVNINTAGLWQRIQDGRGKQGGRGMEAIGIATRLLPVQLVLGVRWLDTTVERARPYEYRISRLTSDGAAALEFTTPVIAYPGIPDVAPLFVHETYGEPQQAMVTWRVGDKGLKPSSFSVFRREGISGDFHEMQMNTDSCCIVTKTMLRRGDSLFCKIQDKTVRKGLVYQYYAVPADYFQNEGSAGDTATVMSFFMSQVPLPEFMSIRSVDTAGLELHWWLRESSAVHGIVIERGRKIDSGFVELFTAAPSDTMFLDMTVDPMERYYYRLRLIGPGGLRSAPSAVVIGVFQSSDIPSPPQGVAAEGIEGGVRVDWHPDSLQFIDGYYVFRAKGYGMPMIQISSYLPATQTSFTDTSEGLSGELAYLYAVKTENSSHRSSALSDTVSAVPLIAVKVPTPRGLTARVYEGKIALSWEDLYATHPALQGYIVYRKTGDDKAWKPVADTLLTVWQNYFLDEDVARGERYIYTVSAVSMRNDTSAMSASASAHLPHPAVYPPANIHARRDGKGVLLTWDEIVQDGAKEFRIYRYTRGAKPKRVKAVSLSTLQFKDKRPGRRSPVFYYVTTVNDAGIESTPSREVAVSLK